MRTTKQTILVILLFAFVQLNAQSQKRDQLKENLIEKQLEAINPSLVQTFKDATIAMDQGNYSLSDSLYSIVYQKASTFDVVNRRLGTVRLLAGKTQSAIELCEKAVSLNRSAYNLLSLAYCHTFPGKGQDSFKALDLLKEAQLLPGGDEFDFPALIAQIALKENMVGDFRVATNTLRRKYPDQMITHYYSAILAAQDEEWRKAKDEILEAEKLGLPKDAVSKFLDSGINSKLSTHHYGMYFLWIVIIWIIGLLLLFLVGKLLSNITLHSIEKQIKAPETATNKQLLRSIYRVLINIGGVYYYISLPIILILVILLVVGLFYLFLLIGRIPIQLMLILGIGAVVTIYGMIRSLLVKGDNTDPGRELKKEEAPKLFAITEEIARTMGTRAIDEIRITPLTDLAVYEKGSWNDKFKDKAKRILILGVGVIKDFKLGDFKAVLAHEYGHFSHRDTAGGEVALRVRNDMTKYFYALYLAGQSVWWNLAFQFLRLYHFIFRRISHGATRLQEVQADRVAAQTFGVQAFRNGLTYVIKREIEFNIYANQEVEEAKKTNRAFLNLYELTGNAASTIDEELDKALNRKTTEDDTHPSPMDRFRYISEINGGAVFYDSSMVKDLFTNWDSLTQEMTELIEKQINKR